MGTQRISSNAYLNCTFLCYYILFLGSRKTMALVDQPYRDEKKAQESRIFYKIISIYTSRRGF